MTKKNGWVQQNLSLEPGEMLKNKKLAYRRGYLGPAKELKLKPGEGLYLKLEERVRNKNPKKVLKLKPEENVQN